MKKKPTQSRSRQTVDALIEATALTIAERGWSGTTTNHVAVRAGVSVGSLYQYFDSRDDLLAALVEREFHAFTQELDRVIPSLLGVGPRVAIRTFMEIALDHCERDEALFAELANHWHISGQAVFIEGLETYFLNVLRIFLAHLYEFYEPIDVPTVAFMLTNGAMLVVTRFFTVRPAGVTRESLLDQLTDLYALYFESKMRRPTPAPPKGIGRVKAVTVNLRGRAG